MTHQPKINFLAIGVLVAIGCLAITQAVAAPRDIIKSTTPLPSTKPVATPTEAGAPALALPLVEVAAGVSSGPVAPDSSDEAARAALKRGVAANSAGDMREAERAFRQAISLAPAGQGGDLVAMDAAKRLGFLAFENRDPRSAETFFGAEAVLARRLYFSAKISARAFSDSIGRFASATGAMGRSGDSAALVFYAQEIKARAQAETSAQLLNRDANNAADDMSGIRVASSELCVVARDPLLNDRVSCADEAGARGEARSMQARQIRASAPPPPTKAEREAKAAKNKGKEG